MKLLIGYDGSPDADEALRDLVLAGMPSKANVMVLTVATPWPFFGANETEAPAVMDKQFFDLQARENAEILAIRGRNHLEPQYPDWKVGYDVALDFPAQGILDKADAFKPDLIVLGSHGHTALRRLLMGSVSNNVVHHAHTSVRINRARIRTAGSPIKLIAGVDGSPDSNHVITQIASRNWPKGTEVHLISVFDQAVDFNKISKAKPDLGIAQFQSGRATWMQTKLLKAKQKLEAHGLRVLTETFDGDPRHILLKRAAEIQADCIFMGCRGMNALERFLLGSVSSSVANHAPCSVEVVRRKA